MKRTKTKIRPARLEDIPQLRDLEERVWKETPAAEEMLLSRIETFPEGNIVVEVKNPGGGGGGL